jgi:hypothetical protein
MARLLRTSVVLFFALGLTPGTASAATTPDQLVALSRAGLDDDILIALIETDGSIFHLTVDDIIELHRQGLSSRVIRAMIETARMSNPAPVARAPEAQRSDAPPPVRTEQPPAPVIVNQIVTQEVETPVVHQAVPVYVPVFVRRPEPPRPEPPVYWGWGGKRRPDSWDDGASGGSR